MLLSATMAVPSWAETVTLGASADSCIFAPQFGTEQSNGVGIHLYAGKNSSGNVRRALLRFDLSAIPPGSTVTEVTVNVTCTRSPNGDNLTFGMHRVLGAWGEGTSDAGDPGGIGAEATAGDATWVNRVYPSTPWTSAGGDFVPTASTSTVVSLTGSYSFPSTSTLVSDVQGWIDSPPSNNGLILLGDESVSEGPAARRFSSRENPVDTERPSIMITFTPPAGCDAIDFNGDGLFPDTADIDDFLSVFSGGSCSTGTCGDVDFNNDGLFPDTLDIDSLLSVFSGGPCL